MTFDFGHRQNKHLILPYWCTFRYENLNWMCHFDALNVERSHFHNALIDLDRVVLPKRPLAQNSHHNHSHFLMTKSQQKADFYLAQYWHKCGLKWLD